MGLFSFLFKNDGGVIRTEPASVPMAPRDDSFTGDGMKIQDVFKIHGRGTVATGRAQGSLRVGDRIVIERQGDSMLESTISGIEAFHKVLDEAHDGDNVGLLLRGVEYDQVKRDDIIRKV